MTDGAAAIPRSKAGEGRAATLAAVARGARLTPERLMLVALSTAIAHIGLLSNSAPVIIGAMLISPLLGPIVGLGFGFAVFESLLIRRSLVTLVAEALLAVAIAAALTLLSPIKDVTPEILARVRPSLFELLIALFGGIAGGYATIRKTMIELVGVAIATALIPPLAVIGFALATGRGDFAGGATLLFVTNVTAIALMATATARLSGFGHILSRRQTWLQTVGVLALIGALAVPLAIRLKTIAQEARAQSSLRTALQSMAGPEARIDRLDAVLTGESAQVDALVITPRFVSKLEPRFQAAAQRLLRRPVVASVRQLRTGSAEAETARAAETSKFEAAARSSAEGEHLRAALSALVGPGNRVDVDNSQRRAIVLLTDDAPPLPQAPIGAIKAAFPGWEVAAADLRSAEKREGESDSGSGTP